MKTVKYLFNLLPIFYMVLIWYLSSIPSDAIVDTGWTFDDAIKESLHLIEFAILYFLIVLALIVNGRFNNKSNKYAVLFAIAYGLVDELHQSFVPYRSATVIDFIKDSLGVVGCWYIITRAYFQKSNSKLGNLLHYLGGNGANKKRDI